MAKKKVCEVCGRLAVHGRICAACQYQRQNYRQHWFVRSLEFKVPKIAPHKGRKPLPGQQELFQ
jgi:hypothetical protein